MSELEKKIEDILSSNESCLGGEYDFDKDSAVKELSALISHERAEAELALLKSLNKEIVAKGEPDTFEVGRRYVLEYVKRVKDLEEYLKGVNHD